MRKLARISVGVARVIRELTNGFSVPEARAERKSKGKAACVLLARSIWNMNCQALTSVLKEPPSSLY
jgi:hypothetical protein